MSKFEGIKKPNTLPNLLLIRSTKASKDDKYFLSFYKTYFSNKLPSKRVSFFIKNGFVATLENCYLDLIILINFLN
jgi:hypothetical protein